MSHELAEARGLGIYCEVESEGFEEKYQAVLFRTRPFYFVPGCFYFVSGCFYFVSGCFYSTYSKNCVVLDKVQ